MRSSSEELDYDQHNLWILDDRLAFYTFFQSDKPFKAFVDGSDSTKEPDLAVMFDRSLAFQREGNRYLKNITVGAKAEPSWDRFVNKWSDRYSPSDEAKELIGASPKRQVVAPDGDLEWKPVRLNEFDNDLARVIRLLNIVRNNLFHGGKHDADGWDDAARMEQLLKLGIAVLDQLATLAAIEADYKRYY